MKINRLIKVSIITAVGAFLIRLLFKLFAETSYEKIQQLKENFKKKNNKGEIEPIVVNPINRARIDPILDDPSDSFLYVQIRLIPNGANLRMLIEPSGSMPSHKPPLTKVPLGLNNFPWVIKMEKDELKKIRHATGCLFYLFYPAIDKDWEPTNPNFEHFTLCVLGSRPNNDHEHPGHKTLLTAIPGQETWPASNYVWYN